MGVFSVGSNCSQRQKQSSKDDSKYNTLATGCSHDMAVETFYKAYDDVVTLVQEHAHANLSGTWTAR